MAQCAIGAMWKINNDFKAEGKWNWKEYDVSSIVPMKYKLKKWNITSVEQFNKCINQILKMIKLPKYILKIQVLKYLCKYNRN